MKGTPKRRRTDANSDRLRKAQNAAITKSLAEAVSKACRESRIGQGWGKIPLRGVCKPKDIQTIV